MIKPQLTNYRLWAMYGEAKPGQESKVQSKYTQEIGYKWKACNGKSKYIYSKRVNLIQF